MSLSTLRTALHRRVRRPAGTLALALLLAVVQMTGVPRIELHAHAQGDASHVNHPHGVDHDLGRHDHRPGEHPDGETVWHFHLAAVAAAVIPASAMPETGLPRPRAEPLEYHDSLTLIRRPTEHFRPPIA